MKTSPTDTSALPHRWRNLVALTGLTPSQVHTTAPVMDHDGVDWCQMLTPKMITKPIKKTRRHEADHRQSELDKSNSKRPKAGTSDPEDVEQYC